MREDEIVQRINELVEMEHALRGRIGKGSPIDDEGRSKLAAIEVQLDQCWDLLRQRRARREFADDPDEAELRDPETVEHYEQ
jgi:hypothetical protein